MAPGRWGTCLWPLACHSSGLLSPAAALCLKATSGGWKSLAQVWPPWGHSTQLCSQGFYTALGEQSCARAPFFLSRFRGRRDGGESVISHPLTRFLLFLSQKLSRISSLGLDVEDRLLLPSSGLKYKELQTLPPVLDELERKTVGRTKLTLQSCPARLVWRPQWRQNIAQTVVTMHIKRNKEV